MGRILFGARSAGERIKTLQHERTTMPKATRAPRTAPTPADRMKNLRTAILRTKLALAHDAPEQGYLSDALHCVELSLKSPAGLSESTGVGI